MTDASSDNQEASKETDAEYTWYEKTVEYKFVLEAKELWGIDFLAPLDGSAERIGDALLEKGTKSFIVEFKKDLKSMSSEFKKYNGGKEGYLLTCQELASKGLHLFNAHYMVGGFLYDSSNLGLSIKKYFPDEGKQDKKHDLIGGEIDTNEISEFFSLESGLDLNSLDNYIKIMTKHRKNKTEDESGEDGSSGGGGSSSGLVNKQIIAVTQDKKAVSMSLSYFERYQAELIKKYKLQSRKGLSFGS
ncbi:hypothetical protein OLZ33_20780 [Pantoea ananatis]|uniref:hypothetical protein n=1 Tax=Pantoea ananas TaxID=553 RepID=UPI0022217FB3|nr:hypothetical protein [Pantoea ananatis]MCW1834414.1 hypothetical protein [Pantoea ananatis]